MSAFFVGQAGLTGQGLFHQKESQNLGSCAPGRDEMKRRQRPDARAEHMIFSLFILAISFSKEDEKLNI